MALNSAEYWLPTEYGGDGRGYATILSLSQDKGEGRPTLAEARSKAVNIAGGDVLGGGIGGIGFCLSLALAPAEVAASVFALGF